MKRSRILQPVLRLGLFVVVTGVAGLLVAGLAVPLVAGVGLVARAGTDSFESLPTELQVEPLPQRSVILAADGSVLATLYTQNRELVPLERVPQVARDAVLAIEDSRFYEHGGVDYRGLSRAVVENVRAGEVRQGASTLTQQYVKNVLLEQAKTEEERRAAIEESTARKLRELRLALALEQQVSKDEILNRYLNIAYFGAGAYGISAAAATYFDKEVEELSLPEAALLAGIVRSPNAYDPTKEDNQARARERRDVVLQRMAELGYVTTAEARRAARTKIELDVTDVPNGCESASAPFFCDWVRSIIETNPVFGATLEERQGLLLRGGLTIKTTLDPAIQDGAQEAVDDNVPRSSRVAAVSVPIEVGTGQVRAIAVNRTFGKDSDEDETEFPLATAPNSFQPGSTFKTFALAAALEERIPLDLQLEAGERYQSTICNNPSDPRPGDNRTEGSFRNSADGEGGFMDLREATERSVNTFYVQITEQVGVLDVAAMAKRLGVTSDRLDTADEKQCSVTLGSKEVSPLEMANAYATLAARGLRCQPIGILEVTADGRQLDVPQPDCEQVLDEGIADTVNDVMQGVVTNGTARRNAPIGRPAAGKTGTTSSFAAAWFAGYTPQLSTAVWIGDPRSGQEYPLEEVTIDGEYYDGVYGGDVPAEIWSQTMRTAHEDLPVESFPDLDPDVANGASLTVPDVNGSSLSSAEARLELRGFDVEVSSDRDDRIYTPTVAAGNVGLTFPRAGMPIRPGGTVRLLVSNGDELPENRRDDED